MAKGTRANGGSYTPEELADPSPPFRRPRRAEIGYIDRPAKGEPSAETDGGDSGPSSQNEQTPSEKPTRFHRRRARTTASHSNQQEPETNSIADSTDTDGQTNPSAQSARVRSTDEDEFDEFG